MRLEWEGCLQSEVLLKSFGVDVFGYLWKESMPPLEEEFGVAFVEFIFRVVLVCEQLKESELGCELLGCWVGGGGLGLWWELEYGSC